MTLSVLMTSSDNVSTLKTKITAYSLRFHNRNLIVLNKRKENLLQLNNSTRDATAIYLYQRHLSDSTTTRSFSLPLLLF